MKKKKVSLGLYFYMVFNVILLLLVILSTFVPFVSVLLSGPNTFRSYE